MGSSHLPNHTFSSAQSFLSVGPFYHTHQGHLTWSTEKKKVSLARAHLHGVIQAVSEVQGLVLDALNCEQNEKFHGSADPHSE